MIPQPVYMNSQQLFSQVPTPENEKTSSTNGCNSNNQGNTNTSSLQKCSLVSNCTITSDENASIINVQPSVNSISTSSNNHELSSKFLDIVMPEYIYYLVYMILVFIDFSAQNTAQNTEASNEDDDDDIKTPTVEELSFPGTIDGQHKAVRKCSSCYITYGFCTTLFSLYILNLHLSVFFIDFSRWNRFPSMDVPLGVKI